MAKQTTRTCDVCRRPCERVVGKLLYVPTDSNGRTQPHSSYTHHADVGNCCGGENAKVLKLFMFRKRQTKQEYLASRRAG